MSTPNCCEAMAYYRNACPAHPNPFDCPDVLVIDGREGLGLPIRDGGRSYVEIQHCPWCGTEIAAAQPA